ncbi:hypothetical protein [Vibrio sonorensis]|uniref:hypothetical protein n=1 Tax=Vibrio sonorensis TaxID=1004316 RepID=UPI0008D9985E|nr:hypothetical protein [Vibrio sonorensis]
MATPAGETSINPFTTLAVKENKPLNQIASELNLDLTTITSDFVAQRENHPQASIAHLLARSITEEFEEDLRVLDTTKIKSYLNKYKVEADSLLNLGGHSELNKVIYSMSGNNVESRAQQLKLKDYFSRTKIFQKDLFATDFSRWAEFEIDQTQIGLAGFADKDEFQIKGNVLDYTDENIDDHEFTHIGRYIALSVRTLLAGGDRFKQKALGQLALWYTKPLQEAQITEITAEQLQGKELYYLRFDDSLLVPALAPTVAPQLAKFTFGNADDVVIELENQFEEIRATWTLATVNNKQILNITLYNQDRINGKQSLELELQLADDKLIVVEDKQQTFVTSNTSRWTSLLFFDKQLALRTVNLSRVNNDHLLTSSEELVGLVKGTRYIINQTNSTHDLDRSHKVAFNSNGRMVSISLKDQRQRDGIYTTMENPEWPVLFDTNTHRTTPIFYPWSNSLVVDPAFHREGLLLYRDNPFQPYLPLNIDKLNSQTWYYVYDSAPQIETIARPVKSRMVELTFNKNGTMQITGLASTEIQAKWQIVNQNVNGAKTSTLVIEQPVNLSSEHWLHDKATLQLAVVGEGKNALFIEELTSKVSSNKRVMFADRAVAVEYRRLWQSSNNW